MSQVKHYGYIPDTIEPDHYIFGGSSIPDEVLQSTGQWGEFLPKDEFQRNNSFDSQNCSNYGTQNPIEILMKYKFGGDYDYSERYLGVMSRTTEEGNSPHKVAETIRKESGLIPESMLPFDASIKTWEQYYSPKPMIEPYLSVGNKFREDYIFLHEWVFIDNNPNKVGLIKEALKRSPLGIAVYAWLYGEDCYIKPKGAQDNHWVCLYGYEEGKYWLIFDQYDSTHKKLAWNFDFSCAKRYYVAKKLTEVQVQDNLKQQITLYQKIVELLKRFLNRS
ncbi:MAG: hypothetical protein ACLGJB_17830 [Blastocatellia bacterium]